MKLTNQQRDQRVLRLLKYAGIPAGLVVAITAAAHGHGYIMFMVVSPGLMFLGSKLLFNSNSYKSALEQHRSGTFPMFRYVYGFVVLGWALFSLSAGFTTTWLLANAL